MIDSYCEGDPSSSAAAPRRGMMSAEDCAREIVAATAARQPLLITPSWYRPIYFLHKFFPRLVDKLVAKVA